MIEVENLTKLYGATRSLDGLTFSVPEGEVLGLLGPNGAGKTTTMRILTGLARPNAGRATIAGHDATRENLAIRKLLGYLPEDSPIYPEMRAEQYLRFMAGMKLLEHRNIKSEIDRVLEQTNLTQTRKRLVGNLSKGNRQRLGIAQALLGDPKVLILDEPTVGLDPTQITEIRKLVASLQSKCTVILSTHILENVAATCTRVVIINEGKTVAHGTPHEIGSALGGRRIEVRARATSKQLLNVIEKIGTVLENHENGDIAIASIDPPLEKDIRAALARAVVGAGIDLVELHEIQPTLEDVFLRATSGSLNGGGQ